MHIILPFVTSCPCNFSRFNVTKAPLFSTGKEGSSLSCEICKLHLKKWKEKTCTFYIFHILLFHLRNESCMCHMQPVNLGQIATKVTFHFGQGQKGTLLALFVQNESHFVHS